MSPDFDEDEVDRRRDEVVKRMLNTPPKPKKAAKKAPKRGSSTAA